MRVAFVLAVTVTMSVLISAEAPEDARATHYCDAGWVIEVATPDAGFYIHDRAQVPGTGLISPPGDDTEGTWIFMENGLTPHLQTGGELLYCWNWCSDDPCPKQWDSDPVIF